MTYLLDTSVIIEYFRRNPLAGKFFDDHEKDNLITSCLCEAELGEGIYREEATQFKKKLDQKNELMDKLGDVVVFDREQADIAGRIRAQLAIKGSLIGDIDVLIAAAAIANNAVLATKNPTHFSKIPGLKVEGI